LPTAAEFGTPVASFFFVSNGLALLGGAGRDAVFFGRSNMNWDQITGNWKQVKGKVKEKWGKLTDDDLTTIDGKREQDDDLTTIDGKREQLAGILQQKYGYAKDQAQRELDEFARDLRA
jgi:uncharacterized protein YjbJ (UPF0337 family)